MVPVITRHHGGIPDVVRQFVNAIHELTKDGGGRPPGPALTDDATT
jgi:hypothetical protein